MSAQRRGTNGGCQSFHQFPKASQHLFTLIGILEADITAIPVVRPESFAAANTRDILVSVQELVYGSKAEGVGASTKSLDRHNEQLSSSDTAHGPRKDRRTSEGLDTLVLQGTSPTNKSLVEKPEHVMRGPEEEIGRRKGKQPSGRFPSLHKKNSASTSAKQAQANLKDQPEELEKGKAQVEQALHTELQDSQEREDSHQK
ncbi:hypothetical protein O181_009328 [Austropuccinia psidii MF-1]|uniref:Uncharacterized protein n=1 Tax=Austropuccinia psidii MF-1 TaxID=1389203 RepID=A0A9Q3GJC8_9BASI|nr:hypothetical protein [Austropuccinia psidii MF-1]